MAVVTFRIQNERGQTVGLEIEVPEDWKIDEMILMREAMKGILAFHGHGRHKMTDRFDAQLEGR